MLLWFPSTWTTCWVQFSSLYIIHYDFTSRNGKVVMLYLELLYRNSTPLLENREYNKEI